MRLFDPAQQGWNDYFRLDGARIIPLTAEERVTEFVLKLNDVIRLRVREGLEEA